MCIRDRDATAEATDRRAADTTAEATDHRAMDLTVEAREADVTDAAARTDVAESDVRLIKHLIRRNRPSRKTDFTIIETIRNRRNSIRMRISAN